MEWSRGTMGLRSELVGLSRTMRPRQWYKQGVMLLGIIFSRNLLNIDAWANLLLGLFAFTAVASSAYIFNDIMDIAEDRNHPRKQHRPLPSNQLSISMAYISGGVFAALGAVTGYLIGPLFLGILGLYILENVFYSTVLRTVVYVDIMVVAIGFVLRAVAGVVAINVYLSPWLIVSTFLLALVLAIGKRRHELQLSNKEENGRNVLSEYSEGDIDQLLTTTMATLLMAYSLYTFSRTDPIMMATLPFAFFGVFRYHHLVHTSNVAGQPEYILTDRPSVLNLLLWTTISIGVLYDIPSSMAQMFI